MSSLSLSNLISTGKTLGFVQDPSQRPFLGGNQHNFTSVVFLGSSRSNISFSTQAIIRKKGRRRHERPWPNHDQVDPEWKSEHLMHLSPYKPLKEKPKTINLQFEKPLLELRKNIRRVEKFAKTCPEDLSELVKKLRQRYKRVATQFYANLEPIEKVHIARHPQRPTFLDHVINMTDRWIELHGDRAGYDDPAIVCALGSMEGKTYMFIGHQKGRNSKENIKRNFGMPTPHGYRKALRFMYYAEQHGFPIITFVDTPGAFADLKSEELNQGEAIANNLRSMFGLKVPIVSVVIGEGGSGGALAIACANKLLMLQNAVFFVASPEACAAILYKSAKKAPKAAKNLRITADGLQTMGVCDGIIPEPLGGAHRDHIRAAQLIKGAVLKAMEELREMEMGELLDNRKLKFRKIGAYQELDHIDLIKTRKMKKREVPYSAFNLVQPTPSDKKLLDAALKDVKSEFSEEDLEELLSDEFLSELQEEVYQEFVKALESLELTRKAHALNMQFLSWLKRTKLSPRLQELLLKLPSKDSPPSPSELKEMHAFFRTLVKPGGYDMQYKVEYLLSEFLPLVSRPENAIELKESYHALCAVRTLRYHLKGSKGVKEDEGDMNSLWLTEKAVNEEFGDAFEKFKLKEEFDGLNEEILALGERPKLSPSTQKMVRRLLLKHRGKVSSFKSASELKEAYSSFCDVRRLSFHLKEREDEKVKTNNVADAKVAVKA